jgi:spermidine synthase
MALIKKGNELWFFEELYKDLSYGFKVSKVVVPEIDTGFQKLMILETDRLGKVLILDGIVQLTEEDEGIYHEWISHWPLFSQRVPAQHVLIIGGGDGGVAREVLKHKYLKTVTMVEIDKMVIDFCRKHMNSVSNGIYDDPRLKVIIGDGAEVIRAAKRKFGVIIIDSTDPIGPAKSLFNTSFYKNVYNALDMGGIAIHQTGSLILQPYECPGSWRQMERIFDDVRVVQITNVSYMGGPFSLTAGSKGKKVFEGAWRNAKKAYKDSGIKTNWYAPEISAAAYPEFQKRLELDKYGEEIIMDIELLADNIPSLKQVKTWSREICHAIQMKLFDLPRVSNREMKDGDTFVQYIETSAINYRRYGNIICANCFTCDYLPVNDAIKFSIDYFRSQSALCWHLPRGSFADIKEIRENTKIYRATLSNSKKIDIISDIFHPKLVSSSEVFSSNFKLPIENDFSSAFELIIDLHNCDYSMISSGEAVAQWAGDKFYKVTGLELVGKAYAPEFGHSKKKTAGPSVTQFFKKGSNISHYSMNWIMIVVNIVSQENFSIKEVLKYTIDYFKAKYAICWILPRGISSCSLKDIADQTLIFKVEK